MMGRQVGGCPGAKDLNVKNGYNGQGVTLQWGLRTASSFSTHRCPIRRKSGLIIFMRIGPAGARCYLALGAFVVCVLALRLLCRLSRSTQPKQTRFICRGRIQYFFLRIVGHWQSQSYRPRTSVSLSPLSLLREMDRAVPVDSWSQGSLAQRVEPETRLHIDPMLWNWEPRTQHCPHLAKHLEARQCP